MFIEIHRPIEPISRTTSGLLSKLCDILPYYIVISGFFVSDSLVWLQVDSEGVGAHDGDGQART
jgi:hypothetical protein